MADSVEILIKGDEQKVGAAALRALVVGAKRAGLRVFVSTAYVGNADWLCIWGVGDAICNKARYRHIDSGRPVVCWDLGYLGIKEGVDHRYVRMSINHDHPWRLFDATPPDPQRWKIHRIAIRDDYEASGKVLVIGMGRKSRGYLGMFDWEKDKLVSARQRFPDRVVMYRPKLSRRKRISKDGLVYWTPTDGTTPIEALLHNTSLVICRHSNVAVDACIANVPVECEDGAAYWLYRNGPSPTEEQRLDFLYRLAWWQWRLSEMGEAWKFLRTVYDSTWAADGAFVTAG